MYNRHENGMHSRETVTDAITSLVDQNDSIQDHISLLSKVLRSVYHMSLCHGACAVGRLQLVYDDQHQSMVVQS